MKRSKVPCGAQARPYASGGSSRGDPFAPPETTASRRAWSCRSAGDRSADPRFQGGTRRVHDRPAQAGHFCYRRTREESAGCRAYRAGVGWGGDCGANWVSACIPVGTARPGRAHEPAFTLLLPSPFEPAAGGSLSPAGAPTPGAGLGRAASRWGPSRSGSALAP